MKLKIHETINNQQSHCSFTLECRHPAPYSNQVNNIKLSQTLNGKCHLSPYQYLCNFAVKLSLSLYTCVMICTATARVCRHKSPVYCPGPGCSEQQLGPAAHPAPARAGHCPLPLVRFLAPSNSAKLHGLHDREILDKGRIDIKMTHSTSRFAGDTGTFATSYIHHHITNTQKDLNHKFIFLFNNS